MKRQRLKDREPSGVAGIAEATAERVRLNGELLRALVTAAEMDVQRERRFRLVVLQRLATIETLVKMIHGGQIATRPWEPDMAAKIQKHAEAAEGFVNRDSEDLGVTMMKYVFAEPAPKEPVRHRRGRNWSEWEI